MQPTLIVSILAGLISYWVVKVWGEIRSDSPISNCQQYFKLHGDKIILSAIGTVLIILNGPVMPFGGGEIKGIIPAAIAGGSIPSMMNNLVALFKKSS